MWNCRRVRAALEVEFAHHTRSQSFPRCTLQTCWRYHLQDGIQSYVQIIEKVDNLQRCWRGRYCGEADNVTVIRQIGGIFFAGNNLFGRIQCCLYTHLKYIDALSYDCGGTLGPFFNPSATLGGRIWYNQRFTLFSSSTNAAVRCSTSDAKPVAYVFTRFTSMSVRLSDNLRVLNIVRRAAPISVKAGRCGALPSTQASAKSVMSLLISHDKSH